MDEKQMPMSDIKLPEPRWHDPSPCDAAHFPYYTPGDVAAIAKLAAELERECCIAFLMKLHEEAQGSHNYFKWAANKFRRLIGGSAAEIERDACVAVCMGMQNGWPSDDQIACAEAIRARGTK